MFTIDVLRLIERQHGAISGRQLRTLGVSSSAVSRARSVGRIVDIVPGVVRPASSPETFEMRCMAVQLRAGPSGFLSGWTAGRLRGLRGMPERTIHFTVPPSFNTSMPTWVDVHRSRWYSDVDREVAAHGFALATPMRMMWGLAAAFNQHRFERAAEDAWHRGLITPEATWDYLQAHRCRGKDGVARIEAWLERTGARSRPTQSNLERALLESLDRVGLPEPARQHPVTISSGETIHLDIAWPDLRLAIEPGASWWHGGDAGQRHDQERDRACAELDWLIVRFDETMRDDLAAATQQVARIYARRSASLRNVRQELR